MRLDACYAYGNRPEGEKVGTEGCGHVGHGPVNSLYGGGFSEFYVTFYEPYYNINYEGVENYFTEEELADLPDRYYIQREEQQIVLLNPVRPGYHFKKWSNSGYDTIIGSGETKTVKDGKTIITFDFENSLKYSPRDRILTPIFTSGCTVTFNPNGGALKDLSVKLTSRAWKTDSFSTSEGLSPCVRVTPLQAGLSRRLANVTA